MKTWIVIALVVMGTMLGWPVVTHATLECDPLLKQRTPEAVLADLRAALAAEDWDTVRCSFKTDAILISDNGVSVGVDAIVAEFQALSVFFGGSFVQVYQEIVVTIPRGDNRFMARVLYTVDTACADVPDGIDTYIIGRGQIVSLTTHGFIQFSC